MISDLTSVGCYARKNTFGGQLSGGLHYLGTHDFNESRLNLGYSLQIEKQLRIGIASNYWHFGFREKEASSSLITFSPSIWYKLNKLSFGAMAKNIGTRKNSLQTIQESVALGVAFEKQNIRLLAEIEKYINRPMLSRVAIVFQAHKDVSIQYGLTLNQFNQHIGMAYTKGKIRYEIALYHQSVLGTSSGLSANYSE